MVYTNRARHNKGRNVRAVGTVLLSAAIGCLTAQLASALTTDAPRVRSTDATMLALLREGTERSATFRTLVDRIGQSNGFVYVEFGYSAFGHF